MVEFGRSFVRRAHPPTILNRFASNVVKPVRRACARGSKFGQDASRPVGRAQCERNVAWVPQALLLRNFLVGLQPTVIASRAPHLLLEQSVHRPSTTFPIGGKRRKEPRSPASEMQSCWLDNLEWRVWLTGDARLKCVSIERAGQ